ncbi:tetratricopeptide repeat domain protein [Pochonia chlamydosporia 170]|uniref:Tetratricopeptide repeat domain protein n=1 Tax=Pochonia chlamydosporia 170 TaxID=1380566 RepID=A0A219AP75_METCM|nr:tetratricopeptide repeat domain protein [Pochonia chlamydosporia 170]OWT42553.1 tetratricopeptide repeat domain protein [Pochonia chlamydosporia 170]
MRLLKCDDVGNYSLTPDLSSDDVPPYAILSHTWGPDEVVFTDLAKTPGDWQHKAGYRKIELCANQARRHGLKFFWVDTCCIDKSNSTALQTAINSMFRWYRDAKRCYVYLSDVSDPSTFGRRKSLTQWDDIFRQSRWFTRGWTLQELIAPKTVDFYSKEGAWLGDKRSLEPMIRDITGIPASALRGTPLSDFTVSEREAWALGRQTKYEEDMAYSLLGIFHVHMPLIYGEGRVKAQRRLREEAQKAIKGTRTNDFSVTFSLSEVPEIQYFVARRREIAEMRRTLSSDGSRRVVTLHGLGGIGKTQLAVAYANRFRDEYSAIFWFNIKDEASIQQSFTKVARQILHQHPNASRLSELDLQQNHNEVVEAVKAWFNSPGNTRWLIVYDNYDNPKLTNRTSNTAIDITRFIPMAHQGSIIVTTRLSQVDMGHLIRIRKLESTDDSLKILSSTSGRNDLHDDADAKRLVQKLDGLPLALATAGAYLRRVSMSLADYLRIYEKSWARLHMSIPSLGSYEDRTLCSTWQVSYKQVQEQNPLAAHLLQWWAYFDNEDIWLELLQRKAEDGPTWMSDLADELNFNSAMGTLHGYGFVEPHMFSPDMIESRGYSIHGCLHSWAIHILNQEGDSYLGKLAVKCIASRVPSKDDAQFWLLQRRLLSHAMRSCATIQGSDEDLNWAFHNLGVLYADQGKLQEAEEMYLRALQGYEKALGRDHTSTLDTVNNLGVLYADQGKLQEAEEMHLRALQGKEKALGPDHTLTLDTVHNLGVLYKIQGKLQEAEEMYLRALQGKEKALGRDHTSTLDTVHNLGVLYADQGKLQEAEEMYLRALQGYEKALGQDHASTLRTVNNLGNLYADQGKLQEAEEMYLRALQGKEKALGRDHTSALQTVNNLGNLYADQGKLQEAKEMYLRALRGYEKIIEPQNITRYRPAINTTWGLGSLLRTQGQLVEARAYYQRAYSNLKGLLGSSHKDVQFLQSTLLDLNRTIEVASVDGDRPTPTPTQSRKNSRREALKKVLGIRSKWPSHS